VGEGEEGVKGRGNGGEGGKGKGDKDKRDRPGGDEKGGGEGGCERGKGGCGGERVLRGEGRDKDIDMGGGCGTKVRTRGLVLRA